jgi:flagellar basal-body rod protein FlgF
MDALTTAAASGLRAKMESLEMLANNLANADTAGYKGDREFYSLYMSPEAQDPLVPAGSASTLPVIERHWTDFSPGTLRTTANPLDLAISGRGFFTVNGPAGTLYTRNGNFRLSAAGVLTTSDGHPVRMVGGGPLRTNSSSLLKISADGTVSQDAAVLGRVEIVDFKDLSTLNKQGAGYFNASAGAAPATAAGGEVRQGRLEGSNVAAAEGAVRLVNVMRQFEMLQKAIVLGAEMNRKAVEEVARVGS